MDIQGMQNAESAALEPNAEKNALETRMRGLTERARIMRADKRCVSVAVEWLTC
jgi:hypothetical protein